MITAAETRTKRLTYNRTIGVAAMQGRGFYYPWAVSVAADGRYFVLGRGSDSDPRGTRYTVMDLDEQYYGTFGAFGKGEGQSLWNACTAIDSAQRLYQSDESLHRIIVRNLDGDLLDTWGEYGSDEGQLNGPTGIAVTAEDDFDRPLGAHYSDLSARPGKIDIATKVLGCHHVIGAAIGLAGDHGDLGHGGLGIGEQ